MIGKVRPLSKLSGIPMYDIQDVKQYSNLYTGVIVKVYSTWATESSTPWAKNAAYECIAFEYHHYFGKLKFTEDIKVRRLTIMNAAYCLYLPSYSVRMVKIEPVGIDRWQIGKDRFATLEEARSKFVASWNVMVDFCCKGIYPSIDATLVTEAYTQLIILIKEIEDNYGQEILRRK